MHARGSLSPGVQRHLALIAVGVCIIRLGLAARFLLDGWMGDGAGGILYAVLAWGACCAVELFQLTLIPRELAAAFALIRLVLGTTFVAADMLVSSVPAFPVCIVLVPAFLGPHHQTEPAISLSEAD